MSSVEQEMKQLEEAFHFGGFISCFIALAIGVFLNKMCPRFKWDQSPPGPAELRYVGNLHQVARGNSTLAKIQKWREIYGDVLALSLSNYKMVILSGYDTIKEACNLPQFSKRLLVKPFHAVSFAGEKRDLLELALPQDMDALRRLRNFAAGNKSEEAVVYQNIAELMATIRKLQGQSCTPHKTVTESVVKSLACVVSAKRLNSEDEHFQNILETVNAIISSASISSGPSFFLSTFFPNVFNSIDKAKNIILGNSHENRHNFQCENRQSTILDAYLMDANELQKSSEVFLKNTNNGNQTQSVDDLLTLLATSAETTSHTIIWALYYLIKHPQMQERLFEEVYSVIGKKKTPSLEDLGSCSISQAFIEEVFRISSLSPLGYFHQTSKDIMFQGHFIPKNTLICSNVYSIHKDKKLWGDPDSFRPDRFLTRNPANGQFLFRTPNTAGPVIPFSVSRNSLGELLTRNCAFLYLTSLVQKFQFSSSLDDKTLDRIQPGSDLMRAPKEFSIVARERYY